MAFDWTLFHEVACELISDSRQQESRLEEAYARTAISRFYYSAFHPLRRILEDQIGDIPRDESKNEYVRKTYIECEDPVTKALGRELEQLWGRRVESDYRWWISVDSNLAVSSKRMAQDILNKLDEVNLLPSKEPEEDQKLDSSPD